MKYELWNIKKINIDSTKEIFLCEPTRYGHLSSLLIKNDSSTSYIFKINLW